MPASLPPLSGGGSLELVFPGALWPETELCLLAVTEGSKKAELRNSVLEGQQVQTESSVHVTKKVWGHGTNPKCQGVEEPGD